MIVLTDVTQHYGVKPVLKRISVRVEKGELVVVLGPNGMGKSTLLGVMGGMLAPQEGSIAIDGRIRRHSIAEELEIRKTAVYLPDRPWLPGNRTGREFLLGVGRLYEIPQGAALGSRPSVTRAFRARRQCRFANSRLFRWAAKEGGALLGARRGDSRDDPGRALSGGLDPSGLLALQARVTLPRGPSKGYDRLEQSRSRVRRGNRGSDPRLARRRDHGVRQPRWSPAP